MAAVTLAGAPNFRDLGGLTATDGRRVRPGLLFRTEGPAHLGAADVAALQALGIRTVCDLRSEAERLAHPNAWCGEEAKLNAEIAIDVRVQGNKAWDLMRADPTAAGGRAAMMYNYRAMGQAIDAPFRQLIERLLTGQGAPVIIHCTAGKDRTGVVVALLLHVLGVQPQQIEADYVLSAVHFTGARFGEGLRKMFDELGIVNPSPELGPAIIGVEKEYLGAAIQEILRESSSLEHFFTQRIGLDADGRAALQKIFLEPAHA
jgi:protein-tyrosine phosphatase